ncbi:hypothetical protein SSX86_024377 [Deinandra increscens subsp. villosa]|uniref:Bulb-type lectin domain-containing protein n=1 Tax=Deinandra increscens subsp. villosa TaxID=3103831 RepID=A0AAP0CHW4_9ASTR
MKPTLIFLLLLPFLHAVELDTISNSQFLTDGDTLVSPAGIFELGFFRPGSSENRYLGIWYKKVPDTVLWVANRNHPITGASPVILKVDNPGILILSNNIITLWSSNTTNPSQNATATVHDNGNLVLMDQQDKIIWQSFDYLTDTLLPGMKLGRSFLSGIEWQLTSWKNNQDPSPGEFTWGADQDSLGYSENKLKQGPSVTFRGGPWSNQRFSGVSTFDMNLTFEYEVVLNASEVSFSYVIYDSPIISRVTLNSSGQLQSWVWIENGRKWQLALAFPREICDSYNVCSGYASCSLDMIQQSCACLDDKRFVPGNPKSWERADWSGGCVEYRYEPISDTSMS